MSNRDDEVRRILETSGKDRERQLLTEMSRRLSATWEAVQQAHDRTTDESEPLRGEGLHREFYLLALTDIAAAIEALEEGRKALAVGMVQGMNVATATVGEQAGVSRSTVQRWLDQSS